MSLACLLRGHEVIRYDRELSWQCLRCLKQWPMSKELILPTGVYALKASSLRPLPYAAKKIRKEALEVRREPVM